MKTKKWNTRYFLWAKFNGNTPKIQLEKDRIQWPGGSMFGFQSWIQSNASAFCKSINEPREVGVLLHQDEFTQWLKKSPIA